MTLSTQREMEEFRRLRRRFATAAGCGVQITVTAAATTAVIPFIRDEADTNYGVQIMTSWLTTRAVTVRTKSSFTCTFGTAAPASALLDFIIFRTED
jgi:hypothetical protein